MKVKTRLAELQQQYCISTQRPRRHRQIREGERAKSAGQTALFPASMQRLLLLLHKKPSAWRIILLPQLPQLLAVASEAAPKSQGPTKGSPPAVSELARVKLWVLERAGVGRECSLVISQAFLLLFKLHRVAPVARLASV